MTTTFLSAHSHNLNNISNPRLARRTSSNSSSGSYRNGGMNIFNKSKKNRGGADTEQAGSFRVLGFNLKPSSTSSSSNSGRHLSVNIPAATASSAPVSPGSATAASPRHSSASLPDGSTGTNPFSGGPRGPSPATRRPAREFLSALDRLALLNTDFSAARSNSPPPAYSPPANPPSLGQAVSANTTTLPVASTADDRYAFLSHFDTIFLIDDSGSMAGRSWRETSAALKAITPLCTAHDADGIDIIFLNHHPVNPAEHCNVKTPEAVTRIFENVRPQGGTPTGVRLNHILRPYLARYAANPDATKPLNIIVITDGVPSDDVESVLINAAKKLDKADAPAWQVGVQFFQVGCEPGAADALKELDDGLEEMGGGVRDIVDTVPWCGRTGEGGLNAEGILKVVLGAVNRRLDRKRGSEELRR
ncbi:hypothetical protein FGG08_004001 [Glutinoglossum americanum]|uniref:VWFA domain-containing protein n=1 Tax=Glutinoglossum americanum TaxID=1670608 RepID=A0A9P8I373_9PEZI|nr:hypothetical protein FGG08_004001 [Glutinoglossum americanum]